LRRVDQDHPVRARDGLERNPESAVDSDSVFDGFPPDCATK